MTPSQTAKCLALIAAEYPGSHVTEERVSLWHRSLEGFDGSLVEIAVFRVLETSNFQPRLADVRQAALDLSRQVNGLPPLERAYGLAQEAIAEARKQQKGDPIAALPEPVRLAIKEAGGSYQLMTSRTDDARRLFDKAYTAELTRYLEKITPQTTLSLEQRAELLHRGSIHSTLKLVAGAK